MRLLLTRPERDAQHTAEALRAAGHDVVIAPLLRIEMLSDADFGAGPWTAILVTSANAAHAIAAHGRRDALLSLPVFAVGRRSAQAMRTIGFVDVTSADGNADDLRDLVAARVEPERPLLYLAGEERSGDLAGDLRARNFVVHTTVVYRAVAVEQFPRVAADALADGVDGVLHFSRSSAEAYVNAAGGAGLLAAALKPVHFCLSPQVAERLARAGAATIRIAARPEEVALAKLVDSEPK